MASVQRAGADGIGERMDNSVKLVRLKSGSFEDHTYIVYYNLGLKRSPDHVLLPVILLCRFLLLHGGLWIQEHPESWPWQLQLYLTCNDRLDLIATFLLCGQVNVFKLVRGCRSE